MKKYCSHFCLILLLALTACGCASKAKKQAQIRRAYAAGEQAARAQMEQARSQQQPAPPPTDPNAPAEVRILGSVKNSVLEWSNDLTLGRAVVEAEYQKPTTPKFIMIYRNNQPLKVDPQRMLNGEDYPLFPGDIVYIQDQ